MTTVSPHAPNGNIPRASGIYKITCTVNKRIYIGSASNLHKRRNQHWNALKHNQHYNLHLQRAWNKYGPDAFTFEVLELVLSMSLTAREQYWLNKLNPFGCKGFNIASEAGSQLGMEVSPETREKLRQANLGKPNPMFGRKHTPEAIEKIIQAKSGKPNGHLGKKHTPEWIEKTRKTYIVTAPDGTEYFVHGIRQFCREHDLDASNLVRVAKGKCKQYKGWTARVQPGVETWQL